MEKNNVRYELDFRLMPFFAENDGVDFINLLLKIREKVLCDLFNSFYDEFGNKTFFKESPKHFTENQFTITEKDFDDEIKIVHISLSDEHEGSDIYCTAYVFACYMENGEINSCSMFTVEKSTGDVTFICKMNKGIHSNFGFGTGSIDGDIMRIKELADKE